MRLLIVIFLFVVTNCTLLSKDTIDVVILKNHLVVEGEIIKNIPNDYLLIIDNEENLQKISYVDIDTISYILDTKNLFYKKNYIEFGASLGSPGILNFNYVRWFSPFGIGVSGIHLGLLYGIQGNLKYKLSDNADRNQSISFLLGRFYTFSPRYIVHLDKEHSGDYMSCDYYGLSYNVNYNGFWFEFGLTSSNFTDYETPTKDSKRIPLICFQIGYVHRFLE